MPGIVLLDLAWNIDTLNLITWCKENNILFDTSVEVWNPFTGGVPP